VSVPAFLITIDTEGDDIWSNPTQVTTENARYLPRFQALCEKYGLKPTYLTNYEMASSDRFVEFARDAMKGGSAEVGMHLHAWNSPPVKAGGRRAEMPYLIEFPEAEMAEKVRFMTSLLEERFGEKVVSHRAGRWAFNATYAKILLGHGYRVDCSVTPHVSWRDVKGYADGPGGTDYRGFPSEPYFIDPEDIRSAGSSSLLEVPMTIASNRSPIGTAVREVARATPRMFRKAADRAFPAVSWFRPSGRNLAAMQKLLRERKNSTYIEFMLHSSELMPGGSPNFRTERSIDGLYDDLERLFAEAQGGYRGLTLREFRDEFDARPNPNFSIAETQRS
jgi:hypothetical protein